MGKLVLASASPRRKDLLAACGICFSVDVSSVAEQRLEAELPQQMAERLALAKALAVAERHKSSWVLGADTDVFIDNQILGKPVDVEDAKRLLGLIQGRTHSVWGAFALVNLDLGKQIVKSEETIVKIVPMSALQIAVYVASGEPMDKAGAYAAQGIGAQFIESINGSYSNVVGLNIAAVMKLLGELKVECSN